jgi:uncharacterized membrane protein YphA (DoxX/SURF4 family)
MLVRKGLLIALAALFMSHGVSFVLNFLLPWWRGALAPTQSPLNVMVSPYGRVIVMHVTILIGAALAALFNTHIAAFVLLIALKILIDVSAHVRKNFKPKDDAGRVYAA